MLFKLLLLLTGFLCILASRASGPTSKSRNQRPTQETREIFVHQDLEDDEISLLLGIRPARSAQAWINDNSRALQLGFGLADLVVLVGIAALSTLQMTKTIALDVPELWGSNFGAFSASLVSEITLSCVLSSVTLLQQKLCASITAIFKLIGAMISLAMLVTWTENVDIGLDGHMSLVLVSAAAVFSALFVIGNIIMAFQPCQDSTQQVGDHQIN